MASFHPPTEPPAEDEVGEQQQESVLNTKNFLLPATHWMSIDHDSAISASSSPFGEEIDSTMSISSSIRAYRTINGRRYHAEQGTANYWGANDEQHLNAMDIWSHLTFLVIGEKLHRAPLERDKLKSALDIGTGTGLWAIDFADDYPDCKVVATDLSPIQPTWTPLNLQFIIEDCTQDWTFEPGSFDYIHMSQLYGSINDWDALFDNAYRACRPGGWIESFEASPSAHCDDGTIPPDSALAQWGPIYVNAGRIANRTFEVLENDIQIRAMHRLGMQDIHVQDYKCPISGWAKDPFLREVGCTAQAVIEQDIEGFLAAPAKLAAGWNETEVSIFAAHFRRDLRNTRMHGYWKFRSVWGRKPE